MAQRNGYYRGPNRPAAERKQRTEQRLAHQKELIESGQLSADVRERAHQRGFTHLSRSAAGGSAQRRALTLELTTVLPTMNNCQTGAATLPLH